ncbi:MAG: MarR family transcriptional regulator, and catechol-resistance regulon repressor [Solirubrobacteraceae bacterium]|jgi:MarR family 2-MHQ and catechol resistance regulon transcriptional repressor|nr:MarR family transcriptional regulator, and catechol-resistance regulon repressor [Solirubrobacteraceae bacterium]
MQLVEDALAHRALDGLLRAEAAVRRRLNADLEREGISAPGFAVLVLLRDAGGRSELRELRRRLGTSKASATEVVATLAARGLVSRERLAADRRAVAVTATHLGAEIVDRLYPEHSGRVAATFAALDDAEKRQFAALCDKLAA